jgi:hypothetical protein
MAAHVLVSSCVWVLAVIVPCAPGRVDISQSTMKAVRADLPIPWPLEIARRIGDTGRTSAERHL